LERLSVFTARNIICGILTLLLLWPIKLLAESGNRSEHPHLYFLLLMAALLLVGLFIDWRRKRTGGRALQRDY
jgi:hypothetical protein